MKKKLISCILVSTMAVSLLAGCGSSKKEEGSAVSDVFQIWVIKLSSWIYASITGNSALNCFSPSITAVSVPARQVGVRMGTQMINCLEGEKYAQKSMMDYEILLRKSTKSKEI